MVKHSVGQTVVHKPQKQHFDISMSNFAAYKRMGEPSEVCPTRPVALIGSISMQSTGHTLTHLSQTIQSSISLCNWYLPFTGTGIFSCGYSKVNIPVFSPALKYSGSCICWIFLDFLADHACFHVKAIPLRVLFTPDKIALKYKEIADILKINSWKGCGIYLTHHLINSIHHIFNIRFTEIITV